MGIKDIYEKKYKLLLLIPIILLVLAISQISYQQATTGSFLIKDISLRGGLTLTIFSDAPVNTDDLQRDLSVAFPSDDFSVRTLEENGLQTGIIIDSTTDSENVDNLILSLESKFGKIPEDKYTIDLIGSSLGESFFKETITALLFAFLLMGLVVFIYFRVPIPSMAVILSAVSDILVTLAIINILGIKISTAGIAAFLMLIGYSVDTDILLSTHVLKRHGKLMERIYRAMKTGLTTTATTIVAISIAFFFSKSAIIKEIMLIVLIGLGIDLINTWIQNVGILRIYLERVKGEKA
jgi:preprotein translocase subunit SecF